MITYNGQDLFSSGPSVTQPGPYQSRDAEAASPGSVGGSLITQGTRPRTITQIGTLIANSDGQLQTLIDAIQAQVGSGEATLSDEFDRDWPGCVMRVFEPEPSNRLGPRRAVRYTITYLQTSP